jgi:hypothetical protein
VAQSQSHLQLSRCARRLLDGHWCHTSSVHYQGWHLSIAWSDASKYMWLLPAPA